MTNLPPVIKIVPMPGPAGAKGDTGAVGPQGPAGTGGGVSSTVPFELNDTSDNLLLSITKTGTGTTRIETPQDDLSLRSARDITLYAGQDGPGNVYIGWGDAVYTPDARNQVVTIGTKGIYPRVSVYWSEPIVGTDSHIGTLMYANMDGDNPHFLVPNDASSDIPIGSEIKFATNSTSAWYIDRQDAGTSTLIADGGNGYTGINNNYPYIIPINSTGTLIKVDNNRWILSGPRLTD